MKNICLLLICTTVAAAGCDGNGGNRGSDYDDQIVFRTTNDVFNSWPAEALFTCAAYDPGNTAAPYRNFVLLTADAGATWSTDQIVIRPGFTLAYYAWHPVDAVSAIRPTGAGIGFGYTVAPTDSRVELIAANVTTDRADIELRFRRLLSRITVGATPMDGMAIDLSDVLISGAASSNVYVFGIGTEVGDWQAATGMATYDLDGRASMLMPQSFAEGAGHTYLTFGYTLTPADGESVSGTATLDLGDSGLATRVWEPGMSYTYSADFSAVPGGGPVGFSVASEPWTDKPSER